jgi:hypothetical protein
VFDYSPFDPSFAYKQGENRRLFLFSKKIRQKDLHSIEIGAQKIRPVQADFSKTTRK